MKFSVSIVSACLCAASMFMVPAAQADTMANHALQDQGGSACQLSVPTTSSEVRPRASGMRNEGSANAFVICQYASPGGSAFTVAHLHLVSTDGKDHAVQCTGMTGDVIYGTAYSTKTHTVISDPATFTDFMWLPADFASAGILGSYYFSVTCNLPPGASISTLWAGYVLNVGL